MTTTLPIVIETFIHATPQRIWQVLTKKEEMKHWYFNLSDFKPETGFEFSFWGENEGRRYLHLCVVQEVLVNKKLSYTWSYEGYSGTSLVTFELFEENQLTRVVLTHSGLETFTDQHPDFAAENFKTGWTYLVHKALKEYSETGTVVSAE